MNTRVRTTLQAMNASSKQQKQQQQHDKEKEKKAEMIQGSIGLMASAGKVPDRFRYRRERKIALQQDVDKLKKKLRHEESIHRALERAFTRPLGALPRLPPYLPPCTLELLAEVAVLEEEVVRLEEQVVNFRQGLYQEAIYISSSKKPLENGSDLYPPQNFRRPQLSKPSSQCPNSEIPIINNNPLALAHLCPDLDQNGSSSNSPANGKRVWKKLNSSCSVIPEDHRGKENQLNSNSPMKNNKQSPQKKVPRIRTSGSVEQRPDLQLECKTTSRQRAQRSDHTDVVVLNEGSGPNKISEEILKCLLSIFSRMSVSGTTGTEQEMVPSILGFINSSDHTTFLDPYGICSEFGRRDIGPYKHFRVIEENSLDLNLAMCSKFLIRRLKLLLKKLALVDLHTLTHQQKLAFWINIYNSCMMNAFLEHGIPASPQMVVSLMQKAMINVGSHLLTAMTIEHFILRLPYNTKSTFPNGVKNDEMMMRNILRLDWPEPLVTFALSCGSWSSPAVRVYTASQVENELETAKRDYLQASVGISLRNRMAIPKLLDWYLLDFAKDVESLMDWICLQLPSELRNEPVKCLERWRREAVSASLFIQVTPYDFSFRYLFAT